jgi:hypothetical protein
MEPVLEVVNGCTSIIWGLVHRMALHTRLHMWLETVAHLELIVRGSTSGLEHMAIHALDFLHPRGRFGGVHRVGLPELLLGMMDVLGPEAGRRLMALDAQFLWFHPELEVVLLALLGMGVVASQTGYAPDDVHVLRDLLPVLALEVRDETLGRPAYRARCPLCIRGSLVHQMVRRSVTS